MLFRTMRIGVTVRFQNSYFSGSVPQVACALSRALADAGHEVRLLYPKGDSPWFIDVDEYKEDLPPRIEFVDTLQFDAVIEVVWQLSASQRKTVAPRVIGFIHYPPLFYDMESCVYMWNGSQRDFTNLTELWTYDFYEKTDVRYLEFLSGLTVKTVPYVWDPDALDKFVAKECIPSWDEGAKNMEHNIPKNVPSSLSWCARVMESNFSNTSHAIIPLNIISEVRKRVAPIRFSVHNGEALGKHPFFLSNIAKNLVLPDLSGNMVPRVRLPELRKEKTVLIAHSRFRPMKSYLLDALYLGIPVIHNNQIIKNLGGTYYYELNQIVQATDVFKNMMDDYAAQKGYFSSNAGPTRQRILRARYSPKAVSTQYDKALLSASVRSDKSVETVSVPHAPSAKGTLRVAFATMWDDFVPQYNFFMYLLGWIGKQNNIEVVLDEKSPNLVFFGPWSNGTESAWPNVPKVYFTGENSPPNKDKDTFLNVGFAYNTEENYVRLPLWVLEINWWGADVNKIVNPKPVSLEAATKSAHNSNRKKFCAFVATNPNNPNRNSAFHILNSWRGVEAGGRLFCNRDGGPIPAGRGGGGGELAKVDYYKDFKYVIAFENSSAPGYTTEKLFHAKVSGAVPIYWGDPFVDRDFDSRGFINANGIKTAEDLVNLVKKIDDDPAAYAKMASIPALSEFKRRWCERTMEHLASKIFKTIVGNTITISDNAWTNASKYGAEYERSQTKDFVPNVPSIESSPHRILATAANSKYIEAAINLFASARSFDKSMKHILYVWPDVGAKLLEAVKPYVNEIRLLPTDEQTQTPWPDYWEPQHFAWKLWVHNNLNNNEKSGSSVLYIDSGTVISNPLTQVWNIIENNEVFLIDDPTQQNERWCHADFNRNMNVTPSELKCNQLWAGAIGFLVGGTYTKVINDALQAAEMRTTIVGNKWHRYSDVCLGHRHDQSILSVLTQRANLPRQPLNTYYCDISAHAAKQFGTPFYVHRGNYKEFEPFAQGIDEAYLINLTRRKDRLEKFKAHHADIKDKTYVLPAIDGRTLTLTPQLVECFRDNDFKWKKAIMGCALSHLTLWEKLANDKVAKSYLIMEDDVNLPNGWLNHWNNISKNIPSNADVVYLGGVLPPNIPVFPQIIEQVNENFARVKKNNLYGGALRRYFHFCNYAYLLTQHGAQKIVKLVKERGIFTSGDHMIVNHGDELLNIYFTIPLIARCWQDDDPSYQNSQFNDFSRIDKFDSDLWNNDERFSNEEINAVQHGIKVVTPEHHSAIANDEIFKNIWNAFLRAIANSDAVGINNGIDVVFQAWSSMTQAQIISKLSWFRILEQLLLSKNSVIIPYVPKILSNIKNKFPESLNHIWDNVRRAYSNDITVSDASVSFITDIPKKQSIVAWHMEEILPSFLECQWFDAIFPYPLEYKKFNSLQTLLEAEGTPLVIYQKISGIDVSGLFKIFAEQFKAHGKQMIVLHLSDEFANDNIDFYTSDGIKAVIRNYWRPNLPSKAYLIPLGYASGRSGQYLGNTPTFSSRKNIFAFSGSMDRIGRREALKTLERLTPHEIVLREKWSDAAPQNGPEYNNSLRNAKFVPCLRGSKALESFRIYEALEHGAIPIYVPSESTDGTSDELKEQFGASPLLGFPSWEAAAELLSNLSQKEEIMEKHRQACMKWWEEKKAEVARRVAALF